MSLTNDPIVVLHLDDDPEFTSTAARLLEREHDRIEVRSATSTDRGLDVLEREDVDCVVSDYDMPETNGIEFLHVVRERHPDLPFVLFTGKGSEEIASEAISAGVTDYLQKRPGTGQYALLANRIENVVVSHRSRRALGERKRRLETLIGNLPGLVYRCRNDPDWPMEFVGGECEALTGYSPAALEDDEVLWGADIIHPDDRERTWAAVQRAVDAGEPFEVTYRIVTDDGDVKWMWERGEGIAADGDDEFVEGFITDITERRERKRELEATTRKLEAVIEASPNAIVVTDTDRIVEMWNPAAERLFGWDAEEVIDEPVPIVPEDRREEFEHHRERIRNGDPVTGVQSRRLTKAGDLVDVSISSASVRDGDGTITGGMAIFEDVTERKERERELRKATDRMRLALKGSDSWIWEWDLPTGVLTQSGMGGLPADDGEQVTRSVEEFLSTIHPDDRDSFLRVKEGAVEGERPYRNEFRIRQDGRTNWIESRGQVYSESGRPDRIVGIATAVTERKERERQLEVFRTLLDRSDEAVFVSDADTGRIEDVNETACRRLGYDREELLSMDILDIQPELPNADAWREHVDRLRSKEGILFEGEHCRADGTRFPVEVNTSSIAVDGDEYVIGVARDIAHRKRRERELQRQIDRLDEFASIVSHDLRNPLNVLEGSLELARESGEAEHFERCERAAARMEALIEGLLTLAHEGDAAEEEPVDLARVTEECWRTVETADARLTVDTDRTVRADPERLRQLLENLVRNAVEHGGEDVTVAVGDLDDGFYLADDGSGIPPADRERVFDSGYSPSDAGTGLGLSIVERIADLHDWSVSVTESADGGARFNVTGVEFGD